MCFVLQFIIEKLIIKSNTTHGIHRLQIRSLADHVLTYNIFVFQQLRIIQNTPSTHTAVTRQAPEKDVNALINILPKY